MFLKQSLRATPSHICFSINVKFYLIEKEIILRINISHGRPALVINLGVDGQATNDLMKILLDDVANGDENGFEYGKASVDQCAVLLDIDALIAD